jgi:hypothetical protein
VKNGAHVCLGKKPLPRIARLTLNFHVRALSESEGLGNSSLSLLLTDFGSNMTSDYSRTP